MAVAVSLGGSSFDFGPLLREQQRLAKQLVEAVPRMSSDPAKTLVYNTGGSSYDTYIKTFEPNSADPQAQPTYALYYRNASNVETPVGSVPAGSTLGDATGKTGPVMFDMSSGEVRVGTTASYKVAGTIQMRGASGLVLASVNRRLADINAAIEAMSRVMQVANGANEGVSGLLR